MAKDVKNGMNACFMGRLIGVQLSLLLYSMVYQSCL